MHFIMAGTCFMAMLWFSYIGNEDAMLAMAVCCNVWAATAKA